MARLKSSDIHEMQEQIIFKMNQMKATELIGFLQEFVHLQFFLENICVALTLGSLTKYSLEIRGVCLFVFFIVPFFHVLSATDVNSQRAD